MEDAIRRPSPTRLAAWSLVVLLIGGLGYVERFSSARHETRISMYSFTTFAGGVIQYAVILVVVLLICINRYDLLAIRPPRSWRRGLALAGGVIVAIWAWEVVVAFLPLPESPGGEQGLTNFHWESGHVPAFTANVVLFAVIGPVVEELMFRGAGQSLLGFLGRTPSILLIGVTFGIWHGLIEALVILIPFGAALAWLRHRTDSVLPGIVVHGFFNGAALAAAVLT